MKPVTSIQEAISLVDSFEGSPSEFQLPVPDNLNDPIGMNMAIITDRILRRGWLVNGFIQKSDYRIYLYKEWEDA